MARCIQVDGMFAFEYCPTPPIKLEAADWGKVRANLASMKASSGDEQVVVRGGN